jgi:hypothetical protein
MATAKSFVNARAVEPGLRREIAAIYHRMLPYGGSFYDTNDQVTVGANQVNTISYDTTVLSEGVFVRNSDEITFDFPGWFVVSFSAQFDKPSANAAEVDIWLRKNGSNVDWTNTIVNLSGSNAEIVAAWEWMVRVVPGDYVQICWSSPASDVEVHARPAGSSPTRPAVPSIIVNVWPVFGFSVTS